MSRTFLTENDEKNERTIIDAIKPFTKFDNVQKLPTYYNFDWATMRGVDITNLFEVKSRPKLKFGHGDGYYLSARKMMSAKQFKDTFGVNAYVIICFATGNIYYAKSATGGAPDLGRQKKEGDPLGMEPHGVIPWDKFKFIVKIDPLGSDNAAAKEAETT